MLNEYPFYGPEDGEVPTLKTLQERNEFQAALDEIAAIVDGKDITQLTQGDLEAIQAEVLKR